MNMTMKMMLAAAGTVAVLSASAITEAIAYSGTVKNADGTSVTAVQTMAMTFRLYDALKPDVVLWARTIPVRVETDGSFSVELSDQNGTSATPNDQPVISLARACASVLGNVQIGLTLPDPVNPTEFRETLKPYPAVNHAVFAENTQEARLNTLRCESLAVYGNVNVDGDLLAPIENNFGKQVVLNVAPNETAAFPGGIVQFRLDGWETLNTDNQAHDRIATVSRTTKCDTTQYLHDGTPQSGLYQTVQIPHNVFGTHGQVLDVPAADCTLKTVQVLK